MDCLTNLIGITDTTDNCFSDSFSADARLSTSGKYMDQLEEFPSFELFKSVAGADRVSIEALLTKSRENGIQNFKEELYQQLGIRYTSKSEAYLGLVGTNTNDGTLNIPYAIGGCVYDMRPYRGAVVRITGIMPFFNFTGNLQITVYQCINNGIKYINPTQVAQFNIATNNAAYTLQAINPLSLDTTDELGNAYSYLFIYSTANGQPRNNSSSCGCGNKEIALHKYLYPYGVAGTDINNILLSNKNDKINGLVMQIEARCTGGNFVCDSFNSQEYVREAITWAILRKSVSNAIVGILASDLISRATMARREQMGMAVNILNSKFKKSVAWVAENMNLSDNDCFFCSPTGNDGSFSSSVGTITM